MVITSSCHVMRWSRAPDRFCGWNAGDEMHLSDHIPQFKIGLHDVIVNGGKNGAEYAMNYLKIAVKWRSAHARLVTKVLKPSNEISTLSSYPTIII